jgi:hypothetical protein
MKFAIRDILISVALLAIGITLAIHMKNVEARIQSFKVETSHDIARITFDSKFDVVDENFRRAGITFIPNKATWTPREYSGKFDYEYVWSSNANSEVTGGQLADLARPLMEGLRNANNFRWTVETEPTPAEIINIKAAREGTMRFVVSYQFQLPE